MFYIKITEPTSRKCIESYEIIKIIDGESCYFIVVTHIDQDMKPVLNFVLLSFKYKYKSYCVLVPLQFRQIRPSSSKITR